MAVKELHKRSVHIDAPVEKVFDYVKDPHHFFEAFDEEWRRHMALVEVNLHPRGDRIHLQDGGQDVPALQWEWVMTRVELVPNVRIVDHANTGGVWTSVFEPDKTGTTLSMSFGWSSRVPFVGELMDRVGWDGDRDLDQMLTNPRKAIES